MKATWKTLFHFSLLKRTGNCIQWLHSKIWVFILSLHSKCLHLEQNRWKLFSYYHAGQLLFTSPSLKRQAVFVARATQDDEIEFLERERGSSIIAYYYHAFNGTQTIFQAEFTLSLFLKQLTVVIMRFSIIPRPSFILFIRSVDFPVERFFVRKIIASNSMAGRNPFLSEFFPKIFPSNEKGGRNIFGWLCGRFEGRNTVNRYRRHQWRMSFLCFWESVLCLILAGKCTALYPF